MNRKVVATYCDRQPCNKLGICQVMVIITAHYKEQLWANINHTTDLVFVNYNY